MVEKRTRILSFGSYCMGENDVVNLMQRSLGRMPGVELATFDPQLYRRKLIRPVKTDGEVNWIRDELVRDLVLRYEPDCIVCCAGGLSPTSGMHRWLQERGILRVGIALSDPDDFPTRSRFYAPLFDLFYTNTCQSLGDYAAVGVQARTLPFAADPTYHQPVDTPKTCDIVVVGICRPDRVRLVRAMRTQGLKVDCYGILWRGKILHNLGLSRHVRGEDHVRATNSGIVYLSFAGTLAGHTNVKVGLFEAAACGACVLTQDSNELRLYFEPGSEVVTYTSEEDAVAEARRLCSAPEEARRIGQAARRRLLAEHTWEHRWQQVLADVNRASVRQGITPRVSLAKTVPAVEK